MPSLTQPTELAGVDDALEGLRRASYIADRGLATAVFLAVSVGRPLLVEGPAGVGKTEVAKAITRMLDPEADPAAVLRGAGREPLPV